MSENTANELSGKNISFHLRDGDPLVEVVISSPPNTRTQKHISSSYEMKRQFRIPFGSLSELIGNEWSTPFMNVSEDGPVFMKQNTSYLDVLVQRGPRTNQTILWYDEEHKGHFTPRCLFHFRLSPTAHPLEFRYENSRIYIMDTFLGSNTSLRRAKRLCNVFDDHAICWGSMRFQNGLTVGSLTLLVNDFFKMPFNEDLYNSFTFWEQMKAKPEVAYKEPVVYETLTQLVESLR